MPMLVSFLEDLGSDLGLALRALRANAGFALVAVLTIAVAIAANSTIFGAVRSLLGRTVLVDGEPRTVIGVLPEAFRMVLSPEHFILDQPDLWAPEQADLASIPRNYTLHTVLARRRPGVSQAQLQQKMDAI